MHIVIFSVLAVVVSLASLVADAGPIRARNLGLDFGEYPTGKLNSITDVSGVRVGQVTLNEGSGKLVPGKGPVRTGVTMILPSTGSIWKKKLPAGAFVLNGNGEAAGLMWVVESGILETPIGLTNTLNVPTVQAAVIDWMLKKETEIGTTDDVFMPVVFECDDSSLNDARGRHVKNSDVISAIENAKAGPVEEGAVGAGTGMISYEYKGGIGTSSRKVKVGKKEYTIGVLLNTNHGKRKHLRLGGGQAEKIMNLKGPLPKRSEGSIVVIVATDAPLDARQLSRIAKRSMLGVARTGAIAAHGSGDVALAFSTANTVEHYPKSATYQMELISDFWIDPIFEATIDATEEALWNALVAAKTTTGRDSNTAPQIPIRELEKWAKEVKKLRNE